MLLAYQGLIKTQCTGKLIFVAENVLGLAYPDDYKLPRKLRTLKYSKAEQDYMDSLKQFVALTNRTGQKPDLKPLATVDMEANVLYTAGLINYVTGNYEQGLENIDLLVKHDPKSTYLGWAGDFVFDMSSRAGDWGGLQKRMKAMLDAGNTAITPEASLKAYLCTGLINEGLGLSDKKQFGDALERLPTAASTCADNQDKAGEALFQLGEVAVKAGFIDQARQAYKKVLDEYGKSKYKSLAKRGYDKLKGK